MSIHKKLVLVLLAFTVLPMTVVGLWGFVHARETLEQMRVEFLEGLADQKSRRLEDLFIDLKEDLHALSGHPEIRARAALLADPSVSAAPGAFQSIKAELDTLLQIKRRVNQYMNVILLDSPGRMIYSLRQTEAAQFLNPLRASLKDQALSAMQHGIFISGVLAPQSSADLFLMLMMAPIRDAAQRMVAILVFELHMDPVYKMLMETSGLGKSGETLIAAKSGDRVLFLHALTHDPQVQLRLSPAGQSKPLLPIQEALNRRNGCGRAVDYRGQKVFAAWRYLPSLNWGLVIKIDRGEALASAHQLGSLVLIVIAAASVLGLMAALQVSRSISRPIEHLHKGVALIGRGDLDYRVGTQARDEIGRLGRAFDQMAANLKTITASRDELEQEVHKRQAAEATMRVSLGILDKRLKELNCLFNLSQLVENKGASERDIIQGAIDLVLPAVQFPERACARIVFGDLEVSSANYRQTPWFMEETLRVGGRPQGMLWVGYRTQPLPDGQESFAAEERKLIQALAERVGLIMERRQAEQSLQRSEQRFRILVENSLTAISIIQNKQVIYQNPEQEKLLGPLPRPFILEDRERLHPDDAAGIIQAYDDLQSGKAAVIDANFRFFDTADAGQGRELKYIHGRLSRIEFGAGEALLANFVDITKVKKLEHLLMVQDKMASLGRVAAGIAHEIRNPLSGINIYVNTLEKLVQRQAPLEKLKSVFAPIQSASAKIESVIRRVMDFAKPSEPVFKLSDIRAPIQEALNLASVMLKKRQVAVELVQSSDLPPCQIDPALLEEVVLNLVNNAVDAMEKVPVPKKIRIEIAVERSWVTVRVGDSGTGIPAHLVEEIFEPFFTTKSDSTGIGLSLCHRIIGDHGGTLHVEASPLGGAEFVIKLPLKGSAQSVDPTVSVALPDDRR